MVEIRNLTKKYGDHVAVSNLSFTVKEGQIYGMLGPNGAGKSTVMNVMTGYLAATEGDVLIDGHDIYEEPQEAKRCIGYLPEQPPLYPEMTPLEYLNFVAQLKGVLKPERSAQVAQAIESTGLTDVKDRLIKNLSKGYKQRVGIAQAIVGDPKLIILDEPTVGLDPKQIIEIRDLIKTLGANRTVILSSHILSEVNAICDQVLIISKGKLVASDTPDNLSRNALGANLLNLTVKGTRNAVSIALKEVLEIDRIRFSDSLEPGAIDVVIETQKGVDCREPVFYLLSEHKCPILRMSQSKLSLEDVFLEFTSEAGGGKGEGAELAEEGEQSTPSDPALFADLGENPSESQDSQDEERQPERDRPDAEGRE